MSQIPSDASQGAASSSDPNLVSSQMPMPMLTVDLPSNSGFNDYLRPHQNTFPMSMDDLPPPKLDFSAPPPYELATKLPSYEEVQREKTLHGEPIPHGPINISGVRTQQPLTILALDPISATEVDPESGLLGTDFTFYTVFLLAFFFNWIGFLLSMCFCHTIAARYGALAGFGLSLTKWTVIVKHSTDLASRSNSWLWWLIMALGIIICLRAVTQYLNIKRGWKLLSGSAQERLLFFY
ncbi:hypothetical protein HCN44_004338 [Aphidius gifuensis]|uniref:NEDD4 family-interacting protein 1-like n=1 Tax=Aphidius gifuensis TaxID=684658 RepID=A0A834XZ12_APHGI|nr:NEDD4 family-interacting protein 1-like [Aphidius gifuensis]KAF7994866.1 hypothetical protein HCN44_004338 [Aphidius gifuensis]